MSDDTNSRAELFQTTPQNITQHIRAMYADSELHAEATCKQDLQVQIESERRVRRTIKHYNPRADAEDIAELEAIEKLTAKGGKDVA